MKKALFGWIVSALVAGVPAAAAQIVPSTIHKVTLFSGQALVQRMASVAVDRGVVAMEMEIAPFRIDPDSVSARVKGKGEILSVQYRRMPVADSPRAPIAGLEEKLRGLQRSQRQQIDRQAALDRQDAFLSAFIDFSKVQVPREIQTRLPAAEDLERTLAFLDEGTARIHTQRQAADKNREELERKIEVAKRELAALRRPGNKTRQVVEIVFDAARAQTLEIEAEYRVRHASWKPMYKVSVPASLDAVNLTLFSRIQQKTGELWKDVSLAVSNVIPLSGTRLPTAPSWILDLPRTLALTRHAQVLGGKKAMPKGVEMDEAAAPAESGENAGFAMARRHRSPLSFEYALPRPLTIASRDKETILPLFSKTLQGTFHHYAVPRQNPWTFLVCQTQADKELLAGPLNLYLAGQYVGKLLLEEKKAGEAFRLGLGADRDVRVSREKIRDKVRETLFNTFDRDKIVREMAYRITAENLKERPVALHILDSVPVSRTDKIQVRDLAITPEPVETAHQGREGVMRWENTLGPGQSLTIDISFSVVYPKDQPPPNL